MHVFLLTGSGRALRGSKRSRTWNMKGGVRGIAWRFVPLVTSVDHKRRLLMSEARIEVSRLPDGQVSVRKGFWSDVFAEERREPWAAWYESMHAQYGYSGYLEMARALRELAPANA